MTFPIVNRGAALAVLLAFTSPLMAAAQDNATCEITKDDVTIKLSLSTTGVVDQLNVSYQSDDLTAADGSHFRFALSGTDEGSPNVRRNLELLDNLMLTLNVAANRRATRPSFLYLVREDYIPLDVAPGKLWFPEYYDASGDLELVVTIGDLVRFADMGPANPPVSSLGWILKTVSDQPFDNDVVAEGMIDMQPILAAREEMAALLAGLVEPGAIKAACPSVT